MLGVNLCGIYLKNPTILASGILGTTKESVDRIGKAGAGAVTLKSLCHEERLGYKNPAIVVFKGGMLNAIGLSGQGIDNALKEFKTLENLSVPVIGSIFGYRTEDFAYVARQMSKLKPALIEVDISCPHVDYGKPICSDKGIAAEVTKAVKKNTRIPVSIKLSPNVDDIKEIAHAVEKAGADAITAINAASGMVIDIDAKKPVLANKIGGITGPALKPIAVRCVYQIYETIKIPIIGTGGITYGKDAIEMVMAGATALGIGTAVYYRGINAFKKICDEMQQWMKKNKVKNLGEIRGVAHK